VTRALVAFAFAILVPIAAAAQTVADPTNPDEQQPAGARPASSQGPMIIEQIHNGFLAAPEAKVTWFDKKASGMIGGSAGWVFEEALFVGGGGYWMVQHNSDRELAYGGVVLQWFVHNGDRFGWSARILAGGGEARLPVTVTQIIYPPLPDPRTTPRPIPPLEPRTVTTTIRAREDFVVAEPELNARIRLAKHVRLAIGAGYRFTGSDRRFHDGFDGNGFSGGRLDGATGTLGVQIGG